MAIIVSDIHADIKKAQAFLAYKPDAEHIFLGDLIDSRDPKVTFEDELACLELILASDATLIWGNHDLAYTRLRPWGTFTRFQILTARTDKSVQRQQRLPPILSPGDGRGSVRRPAVRRQDTTAFRPLQSSSCD